MRGRAGPFVPWHRWIVDVHLKGVRRLNSMTTRPFKTVLDDLEWLWNDCWIGQPDQLSDGDLRRGSSTLRLLLVEGILGRAWRHHGFQRQPTVQAPDIVALAADRGYRLDFASGVIAGGGRQNGLDLAFIGAFRVDNPSTGVLADSAVGFGVEVVSVVREATDTGRPSPLDSLVHRSWPISEYLDSLSAVRRGQQITRRDVIEYFRNYAGGVHLDLVAGRQGAARSRHEIVAELERHVRADIRDGLHFEMLSIGQTVARSADIRALVEQMRVNPDAV